MGVGAGVGCDGGGSVVPGAEGGGSANVPRPFEQAATVTTNTIAEHRTNNRRMCLPYSIDAVVVSAITEGGGAEFLRCNATTLAAKFTCEPQKR